MPLCCKVDSYLVYKTWKNLTKGNSNDKILGKCIDMNEFHIVANHICYKRSESFLFWPSGL